MTQWASGSRLEAAILASLVVDIEAEVECIEACAAVVGELDALGALAYASHELSWTCPECAALRRKEDGEGKERRTSDSPNGR